MGLFSCTCKYVTSFEITLPVNNITSFGISCASPMRHSTEIYRAFQDFPVNKSTCPTTVVPNGNKYNWQSIDLHDL